MQLCRTSPWLFPWTARSLLSLEEQLQQKYRHLLAEVACGKAVSAPIFTGSCSLLLLLHLPRSDLSYGLQHPDLSPGLHHSAFRLQQKSLLWSSIQAEQQRLHVNRHQLCSSIRKAMAFALLHAACGSGNRHIYRMTCCLLGLSHDGLSAQAFLSKV